MCVMSPENTRLVSEGVVDTDGEMEGPPGVRQERHPFETGNRGVDRLQCGPSDLRPKGPGLGVKQEN